MVLVHLQQKKLKKKNFRHLIGLGVDFFPLLFLLSVCFNYGLMTVLHISNRFIFNTKLGIKEGFNLKQ